jgi:hypothetical protein
MKFPILCNSKVVGLAPGIRYQVCVINMYVHVCMYGWFSGINVKPAQSQASIVGVKYHQYVAYEAN